MSKQDVEIVKIKEAILELRDILKWLNPDDTWQKNWNKLNSICSEWEQDDE